jgi:sugar lactone lactonase YvrE
MKKFCLAAVLIGILSTVPASAWDRGDVDVLAVLPDVTQGAPSSVEGLTVGPDGNIYVTSFGFNASGAISGNSVLFVIKPNGDLVRKVPIVNSSPHTLGLAFNPANGFLLVLDFGAGNVLHVNPVTGASTVFSTPTLPGAGLNALTFDKQGNVYISDSFNGVIWKTGPGGGTPTIWINSPLLAPGTGLTPPFGANGVAFNNAGTILFVANTATHQIIQIPVKDGTAGNASIFITGINAPDGIAIDRKDNLWVCANQEDDIIVLDKTGKVIAKLGDFNGIDDGIVKGLLFPASLAFSKDGKTLYVSNLTLYLPYATGHAESKAVDSGWTLKAKHYTVSKIRAVIPPVGQQNDQGENQQ